MSSQTPYRDYPEQQEENRYAPPGGYPPRYTPVTAHPAMTIAGLVLGIISIPAALIPILGIILGVLGFIFSMVGRRTPNRQTMAVVGAVLSVIGVVLSIILWITASALLMRR